jgi:hypothetical protein
MEEEGIREHGWIRKWRTSGRFARQTPNTAEK